MKLLKIVSAFILLIMAYPVCSQDNVVIPEHTPEQEAIKQTERLHRELHLTTEQANRIYEINLRYARERQLSNTRSEAVERIKNKDAEVQQILSHEQNEKLRTKRYQHTTTRLAGITRNRPINSSPFLGSQNTRTTPSVRTTGTYHLVRSQFSPSTQVMQPRTQLPQTVRRSTMSESRHHPTQGSPSSVRSSAPAQPSAPRRTETRSNPSRPSRK